MKRNPGRLLVTVLLATAGCAAPLTPKAPGGPIVSPYVPVTVEDVQARLLPTDPVQVELLIRGTLPDMCEYPIYTVESRVQGSIRVSMDGMHPSDVMCAQALQTIEYIYLLGRDLPEAERGLRPGTYEVTVNQHRTTLIIP